MNSISLVLGWNNNSHEKQRDVESLLTVQHMASIDVSEEVTYLIHAENLCTQSVKMHIFDQVR